METVPVFGRVDRVVSEKLELLAKATQRSRSFLIGEAIKAYVDEQAWQIETIEKGIELVNQGKCASDEKVRKMFAIFGYGLP
ncbi:hypothetical protein DSCA_19110 [Desulfosarcina alkanivorans]|uniref:Uncharacterized protein n=1 Tax=Desulfosarcina alkanivorans TaxID=571177 RepID=A0A5K7YM97_9BACT|nr:ribbon-helix-helix domain-containing protein [Desulfosarcina alkanivorans]BBO67981.1 hypothetical protein DSCA_19110 [Desulfosarcina alkanivorans]